MQERRWRWWPATGEASAIVRASPDGYAEPAPQVAFASMRTRADVLSEALAESARPAPDADNRDGADSR